MFVNVTLVPRSVLAIGVALLALLVTTDSLAKDERRQFVRMERVEVEPYFAGLARVRAWVNLMLLEGSVIDGVKPEELQLVIGGARRKQIPGIGRFELSDELVDLVLVVSTHSTFSSALEDLSEPVSKLLGKLSRTTTRVALITYGEEAKGSKLQEPAAIARRWKRVVAEDIPNPPQLVKAVDKAIKLLQSTPPLRPNANVRKLILVIGDGNDNDAADEAGRVPPETRDEFRKLSRAAKAAGVVIHSIAFSFLDNREPFLNLGELSKKTGGTFRWARNRVDFAGHIDAFQAELKREMILTYFVLPDDINGKNVKIVCRGPHCGEEALESAEVRAPAMRCGGKECPPANACVENACVAVAIASGGSSLAWIIVLVVLLGAGGTGAVVVKRKIDKANKAALKGKPAGLDLPNLPKPGAPAPGLQGAPPNVVLPDFSNVPYVSSSAAVAQLNQQIANMPYVQQHVAAQAKAAGLAAPAARAAQIQVMSGPKAGQTFPLRHGFTVGRTPGCDLVIDDGMTSGHHAQFLLDTAGGVSVMDLGSTNGTWVNGARQQQARLSSGMSVRIGQTDIRLI